MNEQCSECGGYFSEADLLIREDTAEPVCDDCSGLIADEDLSCRYDEQG